MKIVTLGKSVDKSQQKDTDRIKTKYSTVRKMTYWTWVDTIFAVVVPCYYMLCNQVPPVIMLVSTYSFVSYVAETRPGYGLYHTLWSGLIHGCMYPGLLMLMGTNNRICYWITLFLADTCLYGLFTSRQLLTLQYARNYAPNWIITFGLLTLAYQIRWKSFSCRFGRVDKTLVM